MVLTTTWYLMLRFAIYKAALSFYWFSVGIWQKIFLAVFQSWLIRILFVIVLLKAHLWIKNWSLNSRLYFWFFGLFWHFNGHNFAIRIIFFINFTLDLACDISFASIIFFSNGMHLGAHLSFNGLPIGIASIYHLSFFFREHIKFAFTFFKLYGLLFWKVIILFISVDSVDWKTAGLTFILVSYIELFGWDGAWTETNPISFGL